MLVSLKILPLVVLPEAVQLRLSIGETYGTFCYTYKDLYDALTTQKTFTVRLEGAVTPMPNAKRVKRATMKQEEAVASDMGGHRQRGSGTVAWRKGDGLVKGKYRIENKMRFTKGITVTREELNKIRSECEQGEVPLFQFDYADRATCKVQDQWILVPYEHWKKVSGETTND